VAVVAVTASEVELLPAEPVGELARLAARCSALAAENELLWEEAVRLTGKNERLQARVAKLESELEEARRAGRRQAAPFSRGEPSGNPRPPGRRSGDENGRHGHRCPPGEVDEELDSRASRNAIQGIVAQFPLPADQRAETVGRDVTGGEVSKASLRLSKVPQISAVDPN
jgi:hypothetical protein